MVAQTRSISRSRAFPQAEQGLRIKDKHIPWILLAPTMTVLTVVGIYPLLYSLYISTTGFQPTNPEAEQGFLFLDNYISALSNGDFWHAIAVTVVFTVTSVAVSLVLGVLLALLFDIDLPGFSVARTLLLIPMLITPVAVGLTWRIMMIPDLGVLNYLLQAAGLPPFEWAGSIDTALVSMVLMDVWQWTPFMFLIIFAGVRALPKSPFEAAQIDGASRWTVFWRVTLPLLKPVIVIAVLLRTIDAFRTYDTIFTITRGGPDFATDLASLYVQRVNFKFFQLGYGAAVSWLILLMILAIVIVLIRYTGFLRGMNSER